MREDRVRRKNKALEFRGAFEVNEKYKYVGKRLRKERIKYGLSLNELAEETGLSSSFLSLLENGKTIPSLKVLDKLTTFFSIHIADLFAVDEEQDFIHLIKDNQIEVTNDSDTSLRFLLPKSIDCSIEPVLITLRPNTVNREFTSHRGIEFGYILEGEIEVSIEGKEPVVCQQGDSIVYRANLEHKVINRQDKVARGLWVGIQGSDFNI
ncbi:cupin domain-containing protein [Halocella sp. SP3-1]|nr:cupin domain-containing protein [Halocella sp. SP3-1]